MRSIKPDKLKKNAGPERVPVFLGRSDPVKIQLDPQLWFYYRGSDPFFPPNSDPGLCTSNEGIFQFMLFGRQISGTRALGVTDTKVG